jgi:hypothetical protein
MNFRHYEEYLPSYLDAEDIFHLACPKNEATKSTRAARVSQHLASIVKSLDEYIIFRDHPKVKLMNLRFLSYSQEYHTLRA